MMWGQKGGRSLITGNSPAAWLLRIVILLFLIGGTFLIVTRILGAKANAAATLPDPLSAGWKGEKVCELLQDNAKLRALRCTFPPGVGHERHFHAPHWGYVVQGSTMRITDGAGVSDRVLPPGASWWSDGVKWHEAVNIGDTTAVYIIVEPKSVQR